MIDLRSDTVTLPTPEMREAIARFVDDGLLGTDGRRLWLTDRGILLSNEVFQEFINV